MRASDGGGIAPRIISSSRLVSLDTFRGITIAAMLLANHPGTWGFAYASLQHAEWHGWTPTDLVFPFFLFIVGVALTFSFRKQLERGATRGQVLSRAARRALILFALGLLIASFPWWSLNLDGVRIPGVLQRIALTFLAATPLVLWLGVRGQSLVAITLLLGYWALLSWVPVPGIGPGVWQPGKDLGAYVDRVVFGTNHLWPGTWDPEGLLSTIPAVASVLFGALAGQWLQFRTSPGRKAAGLLGVGGAAIVLGLLWDLLFPINKNLWTSSFAVFSAGMALVCLAACYWSVDIKGYRRWTLPFVAFGASPILVYVLSELSDMALSRIPLGPSGMRVAINRVLFEPWLSPLNASLAYAVTFMLFWLGVMTVLHRRGIYVKV